MFSVLLRIGQEQLNNSFLRVSSLHVIYFVCIHIYMYMYMHIHIYVLDGPLGSILHPTGCTRYIMRFFSRFKRIKSINPQGLWILGPGPPEFKTMPNKMPKKCKINTTQMKMPTLNRSKVRMVKYLFVAFLFGFFWHCLLRKIWKRAAGLPSKD